MNEQAFVERKDSEWKQLSRLVDQADSRDIKNLTGDQLREYIKLYRAASTDLAVARTKSRNIFLVDFLNDLVGRAYAVLYRAPRKPFVTSMLEQVAVAADTVRRRKAFVFLAAAIFLVSWGFVYMAIELVPETRSILVSPQEEALFSEWKKAEFEERSFSESIAMGGMYASNNPRVSIIEGAIGAATFGVASVYLLFMTGAQIGALSHDMASVGHLDFLLSSIAPHGVPELSGMMVAGAAGMLFGWALINPGQKRRGDALRAVGKDGVVLIVTSVVMMFIAAPIEAFFSFNHAVPGGVKVTVAVLSFIAWMAFWAFYGRTSPSDSRAPSQ